MWSAKFGKNGGEHKAILHAIHTSLYETIGKKYGLERGDSIEGRNVRHLDKHEFYREQLKTGEGYQRTDNDERESGQCYKIYTLCTVYQQNSIFYILSKEQHRNKINNLSDSPLFTFHLVSSLALGCIQSAS